MNGKKCFAVFSITVCQHLISLGYELRGCRENEKNPQLMVYYFDNTLEVRAEVNKFIK